MKKNEKIQYFENLSIFTDLDLVLQITQIIYSYGDPSKHDQLVMAIMIPEIETILRQHKQSIYLSNKIYSTITSMDPQQLLGAADGVELYIGTIRITPYTTPNELEQKIDILNQQITIKISKNVTPTMLTNILKQYSELWETGIKLLKFKKPKYKEDHIHFPLVLEIQKNIARGLNFDQIAKKFQQNQILYRNKFKIDPSELSNATFLKRIYKKYFSKFLKNSYFVK